MASYLDTQPTKFNPYIATFPGQAILDVSARKQQRYDENVQKIQGLINEKALLPVSRPYDKKYLQSMLNSIGTEIQKVSAADFSDNQLANAVGNMTSQISSDPVILDAIQSTQNIRKQIETREELQKQGKTAIANDDEFNDAYSSYINSTGRNTFNATYTPYTDYQKKLREVIKDLHASTFGYDDPYTKALGGNPDSKTLADAMTRLKKSGVSADTIENAIRATLTPDDFNQIRIDARYQFKGYTPEALAGIIKGETKAYVEGGTKVIEGLNKEIALNANDPVKVAALRSQVDSYNQMIEQVKKQGEIDALEALRNPDAVKTNRYKEGLIKQYAGTFKWSEQVSSIEASPLVAQANHREEMKFKKDKEIFDQWIAVETLNETKAKNAVDKMKVEWEMTGKRPPGAVLYQDLSPSTDNEVHAHEYYMKAVDGLEKSMTATRQQIINSGVTPADADAFINTWLNPNSTAEQLARIPSNVTEALGDYAKSYSNFNYWKKTEKDIRDAANAEAGVDNYVKGLKGVSGLSINIGGKNYSLSAGEVVGLLAAERSGKVPISGDPMSGAVSGLANLGTSTDAAFLNDNQRKFVTALKGIRYGQDAKSGSPEAKLVADALRGYTPYVGGYKVAQDAAQKIYIKRLAEKTGVIVPGVADVPGQPTGGLTDAVAQFFNLKSLAADANRRVGSTKTTRENTSKMLDKDNIKNSHAVVNFVGVNDYEVWLVNTNEEETAEPQRYKATPAEISRVFGPQYLKDDVVTNQTVHFGSNTRTAYQPASENKFKGINNDFPNLGNRKISADLIPVVRREGYYQMKYDIPLKNGGSMPIIFSQQDVDWQQGLNHFKTINKPTLLAMIKKYYPQVPISELDL